MSPEAKSKALEIVLEYAKAFLQAAILAAVIIVFIAQSHLVDGVSMENTLHDRERLMVDKLSYRFIEPKRGEIIVFRFPQDPRSRFVKRVIGIPGDTVEIRNGVVYLNDVPLDEPYIKEPPRDNMPKVTVRPDHVFVMGDNRNNSLDSRHPPVGQVPYNLIVGRALFSYWPPRAIKWLSIPDTFDQFVGEDASDKAAGG
ncbi:MAG: signal peptidase I [Firmicutes bacterium]|nr:signal peptidase I [Bacillota bacterium]